MPDKVINRANVIDPKFLSISRKGNMISGEDKVFVWFKGKREPVIVSVAEKVKVHLSGDGCLFTRMEILLNEGLVWFPDKQSFAILEFGFDRIHNEFLPRLAKKWNIEW